MVAALKKTDFQNLKVATPVKKCESECGSEENITSVRAGAITLTLFSVPPTDESCNPITIA